MDKFMFSDCERAVFWWSFGTTSTMAVDFGIPEIKKNYPDMEIVIACIMLEEEHPDNHRVASEYSEYFKAKHGVEVTYLTNGKYAGESGFGSVNEVVRKTRYMSGVRGARCTNELKKVVRKAWQRESDLHVFGFHINEAHREGQIIDGEPEINIYCPLIEMGFSKQDALNHMGAIGIEIPVMYQLGYNNNNCIGCLKAGGAGYWNKIRVDFPEVFEMRAKQEELLNVSLVKVSARKMQTKHPEYYEMMVKAENEEGRFAIKVDKSGQMRVPLRFLPPTLGNHKTEHSWDCGIFCEMDTDKNELKDSM